MRAGSLVEQWEYQYEPDFERLSAPKERRKRLIKQERRENNIKACRKAFQRLVRANLDEGNPPILVTLTYADNVTDIEVAYKDFTRFGVRFRREFGEAVSWIAVPEFQKRGAVHFHVIVFNIDNETARTERRTRKIADIWGHGYVDAITTDGHAKIATYLAKYMSKAMHDKRLLGKRAYSATRNILRPVFLNTPFQIAFAREEWDIAGDRGLVKAKEYDTLHLGRCLYKQFIVENS